MSDKIAVYDYFRAYSQSLMNNANWYMNAVRTTEGSERFSLLPTLF
jgi:hypothetical protein